MTDKSKTKEQLISELEGLRKRVGELEERLAEPRLGVEAFSAEEYLSLRLLESLHEGICAIDDQDITTYVNKPLADMLGYSQEEMIGKSVLTFVDKDAIEIAEEGLARRRRGISERYELEILRKDGTKLYVLMAASPFLDENNRHTGSIASIIDITERKQAEKKNRQLLEDMNDGYLVIQEEKIVFANGRLSQILGYKPKDDLDKNLIRHMMPDDFQAVVEEYGKVIRGEEAVPEKREAAMIKADGTSIIVESSIKEIQYEDKTAYSVVIRDVTERKQAEEKIWKSRHRFQALVENSKLGINIIDKDHKVIQTNKVFADLFGKSPDYFIGKHCFEEFEKRPAICPHCPGARSMVSGSAEEFETQGLRDDGSLFDAHLRAVPLFRQDGTVEGFIEIVEDITERKQAEEALRKSVERYRLLADNVFDVIWTMDMEFNLTYTSPSLFKLRGYNLEEGLKQSLPEILVPSSLEVAMEALGEGIKWIKSGDGDLNKMKNVEMEMYCKDGSIVWTETTADILFDQDGVAVGFIGISRDISRRKQVEEKYLHLLEDMSDGYGVIQDGKYVFVNSRLAEFFGLTIDKMINRSIAEFMPSERRQSYMDDYQSSINNDGDFRKWNEGVFIREDGTRMILEINARAIQFEGQPAFGIIVRDITERKQAEEKYRQLLEDMNDGYAVIQDGVYVFANSRLAELFGLELDQILGKPIVEFMKSEERQEMMDSYDRVMAGVRAYDKRYEGEVIRRDGEKIALESSIKPIQYEGRPAFSVINRDITERRRVEEKYKQLLDDMNDGYLVVQDRKYVFANRRFAEMVGCELEELIGMPVLQMTPPEYHQTAIELYGKMERGEKVYGELDEVKLIRADGTEMVAEANIKVSQYEDRPAMYAIIRDITERRQMEKTLQESEEKLRLIFESVLEGIVLSDFDGKLIDMNSSAVRMLGYDSVEEIVGRYTDTITISEDKPRALEGGKRMQKGDSLKMIRSTFKRKDGSEFPVMLSTATIKDNGGQPAGVVTVFADITEEYKRQQQMMLTDRLASIGQLAAGIAHEINNPLTGVIGISQLLLEKELPEGIKEDLEIIDVEAQRAANVIRGLLTFVRSKGNEKMLEDINSIISQVLKMRSYEQKVQNILVEEKFDTSLPQVRISGSQLQQVFMNIIINAEQAMLDAHGKGTITVITEMAGDMIRVSIHDDGPGINPENMKKLFTPFFTTKDVGKGTGLGLSICHGIVTEHGGNIYAQSEPDKGATFIIELPVAAGMVE